MKKSQSNLNQRKSPRKRAASMNRVSMDEFSQFSQQLSILSEELSTLKKEKEALTEYNQQLSKSIAECKAENQHLLGNQERLHNETRNINKFTHRFEEDRLKNTKNVKESNESLSRIDQEIAEFKQKRDDLEKRIGKEDKAVNKLQEVILKMRSELSMQERDRDRLRLEANCTQKQILQMEEKVHSLKISNANFMKKIKVSIIKSTNF